MTRKDDDKMGNKEFDGQDKNEAEYNRKVEARFTKALNATEDYGKANQTHMRSQG